MDAYREGGRAVIGTHDTRAALNNGQVEDVIISGSLEEPHDPAEEVGTPLAPDLPSPRAIRSAREGSWSRTSW